MEIIKNIEDFKEVNENQTPKEYTFGDIFELVKNNKIKHNSTDTDTFSRYPKDYVLRRIRNGIYIDREFDIVIVFDNNNIPIAAIQEYEISNPFVFGDVVVVPGHDSITCFNKSTGEIKTNHIR